ncbi:hypothetical protein D5086_011747 [Populus alba]|uniref:Uncharacterized protein n=1 Tax=Populus alba TaxID=43335 RepID=A0ACC4CD43_POPAL
MLVLSFAFNSNFSSSEEVSADCSDPTRFRLTHDTSFSYVLSFHIDNSASLTILIHPGAKLLTIFLKNHDRPLLWASAILNLLSNVHGRKAQFFVSFLPLVVTLAVGTKSQTVVATMAIEIKEKHAGCKGYHLCKVGAQILCSYATLPLYALVTQMGSTMKRSIFDQQTSKALKNWHKKAVKKTNEGKPGQLQTKNLGGSPDASSVRSPSLTPPRPKKFGTEDPDFTDVEADKMATVDLDANHQRRPSDSSFQFGHRDLPS